MKARFIGDPRELEGGKPLSKPAQSDWFDVPEGMEAKYRGNSHYETDDAPPKRQTRKPPKASEPPAKPIETDGGEDDE